MFITSSTGNVIAILSRVGKQLLSDNSSQFKITGFKFSDDEINYALYDGSSQDAANTDILNLPILEPSSNGNGGAAQRYELLSLGFGILNVATISTNIQNTPFDSGDIGKTFDFFIKTNRAYDSVYYLKSSDESIVSVDSSFIESTLDPEISQAFQRQSYVKTQLTIKGVGFATIQINGSNSKSFYTKNIRVINRLAEIEKIETTPPAIDLRKLTKEEIEIINAADIIKQKLTQKTTSLRNNELDNTEDLPPKNQIGK